MALPKAPRRKSDFNKLFLVSLTETEYGDGGLRRVLEIPQYDLGLFNDFTEAEKRCIKMNRVLWRQKEIEFRLEQKKEYEYFLELQREQEESPMDTPGTEFTEVSYNELAQKKDREENFYHPVTLTVQP